MATQKFIYKARDQNGALVQGLIESDNLVNAKQKLSEQGLIPIQVSANSALKMNISINLSKGCDPEELVLFTKQFQTLFKAGMGMEIILGTLARQTKNTNLKDALEKIQQDIQQGSSLAKAFGRHPNIFDQLYVNMLASGEEAGILEEVLEHLSILMEKDFAMRKAIKSAMMYPKIVVFVLVMANIVLMVFVVPRFEQMFKSFGAELPLPTQIMIGTSQFIRNYWWIGVSAFVAMVVSYKRFYATPRGRYTIDKWIFKAPIFGPLTFKVCNARFSNILSSLYRSGLSVTKALDITGKVIGNEAFMRDVKVLQSAVEKGGSISDSMRKLNYFSPIVIEATNIGEKTGSLDSMLKSIAAHYDMEVQHTVKNLTTLIEPFMLFMIFGMVLVFALAIFLPMWKLSEAVIK